MDELDRIIGRAGSQVIPCVAIPTDGVTSSQPALDTWDVGGGWMKGTQEIAGIVAGAVLVIAGLGYVYTAPYPGNT